MAAERLYSIVQEGSLSKLKEVLDDFHLTPTELSYALKIAMDRNDGECCQFLLAAGTKIPGEVTGYDNLTRIALMHGFPGIVDELLCRKKVQGVDLHLWLRDMLHQVMSRRFERKSIAMHQNTTHKKTSSLTISKTKLQIVERLIKADASIVNMQDRCGKAALHVSLFKDHEMSSDHLQLISTLLESGAEPDRIDKDGYTPLMYATMLGWEECIQILLQHGASVNASTERDSDRKNSPLIIAVQMLHQGAALELLNYKPRVDIVDDLGRTALHWAALNGLTSCVEALCSIPTIPLDGVDCYGETALLSASASKHWDIVCMLVARGASVQLHGPGRKTFLHYLAEAEGGFQVLDILDISAIPVDLKDSNGSTAFLTAAKFNQPVFMERLLQHHICDVSYSASDGICALHWMSYHGEQEMVKALLDRGCDVNQTDTYGNSPLLMAAKQNHGAVVRELIQCGAEVNTVEGVMSPLIWTAHWGDVTSAQLLISHGASLDHQDATGRTPLIEAAIRQHYDMVKLLVDAGCQVNVGEENALCVILRFGHIECAKLLLNAGASTNKVSKHTRFVGFGNCDILKLLLDRDPKVLWQNYELMIVAACGCTERLRLLLDHGANIDHQDSHGNTALHYAVEQRGMDGYIFPAVKDYTMEGVMSGETTPDPVSCVRILISAGSSVNVRNNRGMTPLMLACHDSVEVDILRVILQCGKDPTVNNYTLQGYAAVHLAVRDPGKIRLLLNQAKGININLGGQFYPHSTPLLVAIKARKWESAKLLIKAGCSPGLPDSGGLYPIHATAVRGEAGLLGIILTKGVNVDFKNSRGETAMHLAVSEGYASCVEVLIQHDADLNALDDRCCTPLVYATEYMYYSIMKLLLDAGADPDFQYDAYGCHCDDDEEEEEQFDSCTEKRTVALLCMLRSDVKGLVLLLQRGASIHEDTCGADLLQLAVMEGNKTLVQLISLADVYAANHMRLLVTELTDCLMNFLTSQQIQDLVFCVNPTRPRSLLELCRHTIRSILDIPLVPRIMRLPLPLTLKRYICMKELDEFIE